MTSSHAPAVRHPVGARTKPVVRRHLHLVSTVDALAEALSNRILSAEFGPGAPLREVQLATEYGVGRHTLRSAFQRLALEGLLRREPNRGVSVPALTLDDVRELYWLRCVLEENVVRRLAAERVRLSAVHAHVQQFEVLPNDSPWWRVVAADMAIHRALVGAIGSKRLNRLYGSLTAEIRLCIAQLRPCYESPARLAQEHREVLEAIETGDGDLAASAMRAHLRKGLEDILATQRMVQGTRRARRGRAERTERHDA